jgi:hypothetical protein
MRLCCLITDENAMFHALFSAYMSIALGLLEVVLFLALDVDHFSVSIFGFVLLACVDILGSMLVLRRWQFSSHLEPFV